MSRKIWVKGCVFQLGFARGLWLHKLGSYFPSCFLELMLQRATRRYGSKIGPNCSAISLKKAKVADRTVNFITALAAGTILSTL